MHLTPSDQVIRAGAKFAQKYDSKNAGKYNIQGQGYLRPLRNPCVLRGFAFVFFIILNSF
jgi:hypothetical protein